MELSYPNRPWLASNHITISERKREGPAALRPGLVIFALSLVLISPHYQ